MSGFTGSNAQNLISLLKIAQSPAPAIVEALRVDTPMSRAVISTACAVASATAANKLFDGDPFATIFGAAAGFLAAHLTFQSTDSTISTFRAR
jgi:hypothetical protein